MLFSCIENKSLHQELIEDSLNILVLINMTVEKLNTFYLFYTHASILALNEPHNYYITLNSFLYRFRRGGLLDGIPVVYCGAEAIMKRGICNMTWPVQEGLIQNWDEMEKLWHHVFYKELRVPPESTKIMHSVHPLTPEADK